MLSGVVPYLACTASTLPEGRQGRVPHISAAYTEQEFECETMWHEKLVWQCRAPSSPYHYHFHNLTSHG